MAFKKKTSPTGNLKKEIQNSQGIQDNQEILTEEITYQEISETNETLEIPESSLQKTIQVKFIRHFYSPKQNTTIFVDSSGNGIEVPLQDEHLNLKPGDVYNLRI